jgi:hypothetical protein
MCNKTFRLELKLLVICESELVKLTVHRKNMNFIPPIGTFISLYDGTNVRIDKITAPLSFDVVTCDCSLYINNEHRSINQDELGVLKKLGWKSNEPIVIRI